MKDHEVLVNEIEPSFRFEPKHSRCYCAAIAGAVATVGSAAYGAYATSQAGKGVEGGGSNLYGKKIKPVEYENNASLPSYDAMQGAGDYLHMLPVLNDIAKRTTKQGVKMREIAMPGSKQIMSEAAANLIAMSRGQVRGDVVDVTNQIVAERTGGGRNAGMPESYAGSGDQASTEFARNIGRTSQQNVSEFLSAAPTWEQLADKFAYTPEEAAAGAMEMLRQRNSYSLATAQFQKGIDENMYTASLNEARMAAGADPAAVGARNDALLQQSMAGIQGNGYLTSINGVVSGLSSLSTAFKGSGGGATKITAGATPQGWKPGPQTGTYYAPKA